MGMANTVVLVACTSREILEVSFNANIFFMDHEKIQCIYFSRRITQNVTTKMLFDVSIARQSNSVEKSLFV